MSTSRKAACVAVLLVAALVILLMRQRPAAEAAANPAGIRNHRTSSTADAETGRRHATSRGPSAAADQVSETPEARHFRNFYLPPARFNNPEVRITPPGVVAFGEPGTLAEAIDWVKSEYANVAERTGETALPLAIDLSAADTTRFVNFNLPRLPVTSALGMIAAATGNRLQGTGPAFALVATPDSSTNDTFEWNEGLIATSLLAIPERRPLTAEDFAADGTCLMTLRADLNTANSEDPPPNLVQTLRNLGFPLSEGLSIHPSEDSPLSHITAEHATASDLAILRAATEALQPSLQSTQQNKLVTNVVELPGNVDVGTFTTGNLDAAAYDALINRVDTLEGATRTALPSITARYGQTAIIDIQGTATTGLGLRNDLSFSVVSRPLGLGSEDTFNFQQTPPGAPEDAPVTPYVEITGQSTAPNGNRNVSLGTTADGRHVLLIRTIERIDATGRPVDLSNAP